VNKNDKIYVAGHQGMVGTAIQNVLSNNGYENIVNRTHEELDLIDQSHVSDFFVAEKPEIVIIAAAKVGGILANDTYRAQFLYENLMIESNIIHQSYLNNVKKLLFLGSSCIYPVNSDQPIREDYLLKGILEPTNEPYAIAKIAGIKLCQNYFNQYSCNYFSAMPSNLYGPNDNFDLKTSHVIPALIRKFHVATQANEKSVTIWGSGTPLREFLFVDDLAECCVFLLENINADDVYSENISHINIGSGSDISIADLAKLIAKVTSFEGAIEFDKNKPDGVARKLLDVTAVHDLGWTHTTSLEEGLEKIYSWFVQQENS